MEFENYEHFKRLVLSSPNSEIEYLPDFDFEWGYQYVLSVSEVLSDDELSDGTRFEYSVDSVISKDKMPDTMSFKMFLEGSRYYYEPDLSEQEMNNTVEVLNDSIYLYFDQVEIEVPIDLREQFNDTLKRAKGKTATFIFINERRIRLIRL